MYRERLNFKVKLKYDQIDRETRYAYLRGDIVEVDDVGDPPDTIMGVSSLVIADTNVYLDWDDYDII